MKQQTIFPALLAAALLIGFSACKKDPVEPNPQTPQQQVYPNPLPADALVKQLKWAPNDHQTFTYNNDNQVSRLVSQWQYVEGDPTQIKSVTYDFEYDAQKRPLKVTDNYGYASKYFYNANNQIAKNQEVSPDGTVNKEVSFVYANSRVIQENWRVNGEPIDSVYVYKHVFSYDTNGNLNKIEVFERLPDLQFKLLETTTYSDFDDKLNVGSWLLRFPYLPQMQYQFNNPRKQVRQTAGGTAEVTTHEYVYNAKGRPLSRTSNGPGGSQTVTYQY